jgi:hypothetical protein
MLSRNGRTSVPDFRYRWEVKLSLIASPTPQATASIIAK